MISKVRYIASKIQFRPTYYIQTNVCNQIINEKLIENFWSAGFSDIPAINATVFSMSNPKWVIFCGLLRICEL